MKTLIAGLCLSALLAPPLARANPETPPAHARPASGAAHPSPAHAAGRAAPAAPRRTVTTAPTSVARPVAPVVPVGRTTYSRQVPSQAAAPAYGSASPRAGAGAGASRNYVYHGRAMPSFRAAAYPWPRGYGYRRWFLGAFLPQAFWLEDAWVDWAALGLDPPCCGWRWIRYGPDVLLIDPETGQIHDIVYGVFLDG